jgi:dipeptidyl aminopeptidase/acylaminoacyl peptidase
MRAIERAHCWTFCGATLAALVCASALAAPAAETGPQGAAAAPRVEDYFRKPQFPGAWLARDGRHLAVLAPMGERVGLGVFDLATHTLLPPILSPAGDIMEIQWQTDERLLLIVGEVDQLSGEPPRRYGIMAMDRDGGRPHEIGGKYLANSASAHQGFERPWSVALEKVIPGSTVAIFSARDRTIDSEDLYRVDTVTGEKTLLTFESPGNVSHWVLDFDDVPRAARTDDAVHDRSAWYVRTGPTAPWAMVEEAHLGELSSEPMQFSEDGKTLFVSTRREGADRAAIYEFDVEHRSWGGVVARHPSRDIRGGASPFESNARFLVDPVRRRLLGLHYTSDKPAVVWFDAEWAGVQKTVDQALPDTVNTLQSSADGSTWVVLARSDRNPGETYRFDARTLRLEKLFSAMPWIDPTRMVSTRWVRYPARDGLSIPALLTEPATGSPRPAPLVVLIHGGPNVEATPWGFGSVTQFFAARGYATLQPQFRGTFGFGWKLASAGFRHWGDEMQDDLADGVKWAVAQGIADPRRVCFYGASYGGYAAAWGAIRNADILRCSVVYAGVTSIDKMFDSALTDFTLLADRSEMMRVRIGDPDKERERFRRVSPVAHAAEAGVPVLIGHGSLDRRVPIDHAKDFRAALDRAGRPYEWVVYDGEGHGLNRQENIYDFYRRVDAFLQKSFTVAPATAAPAAAR